MNLDEKFSTRRPWDTRRLKFPAFAQPRSYRRHPAFTLLELMIVISILAIVLAMGVPALFRAMRKEGLRKAEADLMEACSHARAQAILSGRPTELIIRAEGNRISVQPLQGPAGPGPEAPPPDPEAAATRAPAAQEFSAQMADDIGIRLLAVNFMDHMELPEAHVRFFPNGTCDEFTIVFFSTQGERKLSLDIVTGYADLETLR